MPRGRYDLDGKSLKHDEGDETSGTDKYQWLTKSLARMRGWAAVLDAQEAGYKIGALSPAQQSFATAMAVSGAAGALLKLKNKNKASP